MFSFLSFVGGRRRYGEIHTEEEATQVLQEALRHYEAPGLLPPDSRVDPRLPQREAGSLLSIRSMVKLTWFVATKSTEVLRDVVAHQVYGPKRPTWGIEMTILSSFMRNLAQHSELTNIVALRAMMAVGGLVPTPSSALITPVTFYVERMGLRGILQEPDAQEKGYRELRGEWIVGKELWHDLQHTFREGKKPLNERVILYLHGGAYYVFSAATHRLITIKMSRACGVRVFAVNYRLAPETRFPGALHDAVVSYRRLTDHLHIHPKNIIVAGDSAGGGLTLALLMYLRDNGYDLPGGAILLSPWVDLTMSCASWDTNAQYDVCPMPSPGDHMNPVYCYMGPEGMKKGMVTHPYASPLFGDFTGLPPMLVQCGEAEVLRDEGTLLAHKATRAGVKVVHELYEDAVHVFQTFPFLAVAQKAYQSMNAFVTHSIPHDNYMEEEDDDDQSIAEIAGRQLSVDSVGNEDTRDSKEVESPETSSDETTPCPSPRLSPVQDEVVQIQAALDDLAIATHTATSPLPAANIPRSKSATSLHTPGDRTPPAASSFAQRRHKRTATTFAALSGFTPARLPASADSSDLNVKQWAFTLGSRPTSPTASTTFCKPPSAPQSVVGDDDYFAYAEASESPTPITPAPGVRSSVRSRSNTLSSFTGEANEPQVMEIERMCREWETDGPANVSVWCRRVQQG